LEALVYSHLESLASMSNDVAQFAQKKKIV